MTATLATAGHEWIHQFCRRMADQIGVPVAFLPAADSGEPEAAAPGSPAFASDLLSPGSSVRVTPDAFLTAAEGVSDRHWVGEVHDGQQCLGHLHVDFPADAVPEEALPRVWGLADLMADLLNRLAVAARSLESRTRQVTTLVDLGRSLSGDRALFDSLNRLLEGAVQVSGFRSAAFFLLDPATGVLNLRGLSSPGPSPVPVPRRDLTLDPPDLDALARGRVLLRRDQEGAARWLPDGAESALCVPVKSEAGPIGTLWVFDRRRRSLDTSERDTHVLESISVQIAVLLERVVLLRESSLHQRLRRDLRAASQNAHQGSGIGGEAAGTALLTSEPRLLAAGAGLDVAALCTSRYELGGDLCELIPLGPHRTAVAVGDASGDGVQAALVMSAVRGALRALALGEADTLRTDRLVQRVNRALHEITPCHQFMSLLYGIVDTREGTFSYTNAGHPCPILRHRGGTSLLETHGMLLGIAPDAGYERSVVPLDPGDTLVLFSDGVTEALSVGGRMFRDEGVLRAMEGCPDGASQAVLHAIWSSLHAHLRGSRAGDDRTLLVLRIEKNS